MEGCVGKAVAEMDTRVESRSCTQETRKQPGALSCPHMSSVPGEEAPKTPLAGSELVLHKQGEPGVMGLGPAAVN